MTELLFPVREQGVFLFSKIVLKCSDLEGIINGWELFDSKKQC